MGSFPFLIPEYQLTWMLKKSKELTNHKKYIEILMSHKTATVVLHPTLLFLKPLLPSYLCYRGRQLCWISLAAAACDKYQTGVSKAFDTLAGPAQHPPSCLDGTAGKSPLILKPIIKYCLWHILILNNWITEQGPATAFTAMPFI